MNGNISGVYNGSATTSTSKPRVNVPISKTGNGNGFDFDYNSAYGVVYTVLVLGSISKSCCSAINGGAISGTDAYSIDLKVDDGIPNTGLIWAIRGVSYSGSSNCFNQPYGSAQTTVYNGPQKLDRKKVKMRYNISSQKGARNDQKSQTI